VSEREGKSIGAVSLIRERMLSVGGRRAGAMDMGKKVMPGTGRRNCRSCQFKAFGVAKEILTSRKRMSQLANGSKEPKG